MLFFTAAMLLCVVRDAQCKTRESPYVLASHAGVLGELVGYLSPEPVLKPKNHIRDREG